MKVGTLGAAVRTRRALAVPAVAAVAALLSTSLASNSPASPAAGEPSAVAAAQAREKPAFGKARLGRVAIIIASDRLQAGSLGEVIIRAPRRSTCGLMLIGPNKLGGGPYRLRMSNTYATWRWTVPDGVRPGKWAARVSCRKGKRGRAVTRTATLRVVGPAGDAFIVADGSLATTLSTGLPSTIGGASGGKGGGGYPHDDAVCMHTGARGGKCRNYDWGYRRANGTWALLSSRGFYYRNCTDFAAWFAGVTWGQFKFPGGKGHAAHWKDSAHNVGMQVTQTPSVGDIAWWGKSVAGGYGHVAIVTAVTGGTVTIAEYNGEGAGNYRIRDNVRAEAYLHRPSVSTPPPPPPPPPAVTPAPTAAPQPSATPAASTTPAPAATPAPAPPSWDEQQGSLGANTFQNPTNASGMGQKIQPYQWVKVSCKVYAPQIQSANPDGYWYRIASAPWNNQYYAVANTFWNGDVPGQKPYTHYTDWAVANC